MAHKTDLQLAFDMLQAKSDHYTSLFNYYDGRHELKYSSSRLKEVFKRLDTSFTQNWCATVVDAALERITLKAFDVTDSEEISDRLNRIWADTEMTLDSEDAHTAALVTGEAFVMVWRNEGEPVEVFYNDPRMCHIFYDAENPRIKRFAVKWWKGDDHRTYLNLYYPDRIEHYISTNDKDVSTANAFAPLDLSTGEPIAVLSSVQPTEHIEPNPTGKIPIFHLRRERRTTKSELTNVIPLQDSINKLLSDMMVSAEFAAFKQRYVISAAEIQGQLKNAPNQIWALPAGMGEGVQPTTVGELSATDLDNYLKAIEQLAMSIGVISRTPKHYFFQTGTSNVSGDALIALEAPLNKKVETYIKRFQTVWQQVAEFVLELEGVTVDSTQIVAVFDTPQTVQPLARAQTREINVRSGIPLMWQLRQEGYTDAQLEELQADMLEAERQRDTLGGMLLRDFERGQIPGVTET